VKQNKTVAPELVRFARIADELEIRNLIARIYQLSDHDPDLDAYGDSFTEDAVWERVDGGGPGSHASTRIEGRDAILEDRAHRRRAGRAGPGQTIQHLITTVVVSVSDDGTAQAESKFLVVDGAKPRPVIDAVGRYQDSFRRTASGWKLAHRRYSSLSARH